MSQTTENTITLKGSADIVTEFFDYGINSIIYQRGIHPVESFSKEKKYGLTLLMTEDEELKTFISTILKQLQNWLLTKEVHRLVVVISNFHTKETLERWEFKIECQGEMDGSGKQKSKDIKEIQNEIRAIIRQITASVSFLPLLDNACSFDVLLYTNKDIPVPDEWADSTAHLIPNCEEVRLSNFSTSVHKVDPAVQYKSCD
ncbi:LOW QUALITY PROTEIN: mitotic spindle assembly checkpoint protein MAD2A-like [Uloborus diversus]|uniref:LOW QUALITY PROTEIN: mitotic spindle assembly checkpoint protein MAD2A-like n=1 Tax=Uloborus diversus TaxID=327109 RepID=UPI0024093F20|nr:LOW QUALITY PROTEIN: mitotic spindle assembly checkpoint protein MAD2A-like [Uloborus diversus]